MANEKRLIDANALLEKLKKTSRYFTVKFDIEEAPTVDAVEVVHGEWEIIEDDYLMDTIYKCSVCKEEFVTIDGTPAENLWNYCPCCGAKMDGDVNG